MEKENKELKEIIEKLKEENFELRKKLHEIENYINSHLRNMINELKYNVVTKKDFYSIKKIAYLDQEKILNIIHSEFGKK